MCLLSKTRFSNKGLIYYLISVVILLVQIGTFWLPLNLFKEMEMEEFYPDEIEDLQEQYQVWRKPFIIDFQLKSDENCPEGYELQFEPNLCSKRGS